MNAKPISPILSVSEQIRPEDVAVLFAAGFKSIVCNRPDGEGPDQPDFAEIEAAAKAAGIVAAYLPVVSGQIGDEDAAAFGSLLDSLPKPVLAFCRTGTRSATLWSLSEGAGDGHSPRFWPPQSLQVTTCRALSAVLLTEVGYLRTVDAAHAIVVTGGGTAGIDTVT